MKVFICLAVLALAGYAQSRANFFSNELPDVDSSEFGGPSGRRSTTCKCGWANKNGLRVVGGKETKTNEYPFAVAIIDKRANFPFCGGTIATTRHIITAAHCTDDFINPSSESYMRPLIVSAGDHDLKKVAETRYTQTIDVASIFQHEGYNPNTIANDISILYLRSPLTFNDGVGPACMLSAPINIEKKAVNVIGWGRVAHTAAASPVLKTATLRIVPHDKCRRVYYNLLPTRTQVCTHRETQGACMGDSGGPLVWLDPDTNRYTLVGVVSFGRVCASDDPSVYTDPASYLDWIKRTIAQSSPSNMCYKA